MSFTKFLYLQLCTLWFAFIMLATRGHPFQGTQIATADEKAILLTLYMEKQAMRWETAWSSPLSQSVTENRMGSILNIGSSPYSSMPHHIMPSALLDGHPQL